MMRRWRRIFQSKKNRGIPSPIIIRLTGGRKVGMGNFISGDMGFFLPSPDFSIKCGAERREIFLLLGHNAFKCVRNHR